MEPWKSWEHYLNEIEERRGFLTPEEQAMRRRLQPEESANRTREEGMEYVVKNWQGR